MIIPLQKQAGLGLNFLAYAIFVGLLLARPFLHPYLFISQCVNICVNPNLDLNVQVHFPRTVKATVMIVGISLLLGMTTQTAVSIFDLDLYFMVHRL